ncbi:hypothetical protein VTI28DRAFT_8386 [Corynascus sepedonium]
MNFARDPKAPEVQAPVKAFLHTYVESSYQERVVLGPEERAMVRTVNCTFSVIEVWRRLIAAADFKVLRGERAALRRREKYLEADRLFLKWPQEGEKRDGPAYTIVKWIIQSLSPELNLEMNSSYGKVEATAEDIIIILKTLYGRETDIPASPLTRVGFHHTLLDLAIGGHRPGCLEDTLCRQYTIAIVRDPDNPTRTRPIVTANINRNKIKETQKTCKYKKQLSVAYHITTVPYPLLCSASLVITRAIEMDALDMDYKTVHEFLHRPALGRTNYLVIPWKEEFLDKPLFPLTYKAFWELWNRCLLVAGIRRPIRPYSLRVGAGARLNDNLSSALRNYIMGHTGAVFENDYQTAVVRSNLAVIAFGPKAVRRDESLFNDLRNMTLSRDEGAPVWVPKEQIEKFHKRNDIAKFRAQIQASTDKKEKNRLYRQISSTIDTCKKLQLDANREAYFKEADRLRLQGCEPEPTPGAGGPDRAAPVAELLSRLSLEDKGESLTTDTSVSERYIEAQLVHLSSTTPRVPRRKAENAEPPQSKRARRALETAAASKSQQLSCCFVCSKGFASHSSLTRHFRNSHLVDGTFDKPLACRECKRAKAPEAVVHGPAQWCNHLEHIHGLIHTPNVNPGASPRDCPSNSTLVCLLCEAPMTSTSTLLDHMNRTEIPRYRQGLHVACRACTREGRADVKPISLWEWLTHARAVHKWSLPRVEPCLLCGHLCAPGPGFRRHFTAKHSHRPGEPLECAACVASTMPVPAQEMQGIHGFEELLRHAMEKHPSGQAATDVARGKHEWDGDDGEYAAPAAARARTAKHNVAYKKEPSPFVIYDTGSDVCEDVIICASTVDEQQPRYLGENHTGPSVILHSDFLGHVDPALLAP